jgi:LmbE family N-acetylglucosaminyl deacetylase
MNNKQTMATIFALHAHPDDIEFMMAGTLFLLKERGHDIHYMTVANGSCGAVDRNAEEISKVRREEAQAACAILGAVFHEALVPDLEVFYSDALLRRVAAVIREIAPDVLLLPPLHDYMEDHMNVARLGVTAAFARGMRNYRTEPPLPPVDRGVVLYHALPYGLRDGLRRPPHPDFCVDITHTIERKKQMLACHRSQQDWLQVSQGENRYLAAIDPMAREVGRWSGRFEYAEGWIRHLHLGFSEAGHDPLPSLLGPERVAALPRGRVGRRGARSTTR